MKENTNESHKKTLDKIEKFLVIINDWAILPFYLLCLLSEVTSPDHTSHFKLVKDPNSNRINDLLIYETTPYTL